MSTIIREWTVVQDGTTHMFSVFDPVLTEHYEASEWYTVTPVITEEIIPPQPINYGPR